MDEKRELIELLQQDARTPIADLARQTGMSEDRVEATIEELEDDGILLGYQAVVNWDRSEVDRARAAVELNVTLDRETGYEDVAARLSGFPEVTSLWLVSGNYDFLMTVDNDSVREISRFVSEKVAPVPEVTQTVTHFVMDTYKQQGVPIDDGHDDDRLSITP